MKLTVKIVNYLMVYYMVRNRLKEIRMKEYMMAPGEFAKYLGISIRMYSAYENSHSNPTIEGCLKISKILNKNINDIWYLDE